MARVTVEDCLEQINNRFALVLLASRRARMLLKGATPLVDNQKNKSPVLALREVAEGRVRYQEDPKKVLAVTFAELRDKYGDPKPDWNGASPSI